MLPVRITNATQILSPPAGWDDGDPALGPCHELPIRRSEDGFQMTSWWKPTDEELAILNRGGFVEFVAVGDRHPVVALGAVDPKLEAFNAPAAPTPRPLAR